MVGPEYLIFLIQNNKDCAFLNLERNIEIIKQYTMYIFLLVASVEVKTREKLEAAKKKTSFEIAELKERLKASRETINCLKNEIRKLEDDDQTKDI